MIKVGVTGGIGSGKSTLCHAFEVSGVPIYYSDREAKRLMSDDEVLREKIIAEFGAESYIESDGTAELNRPYLAREVFGSDARRESLNALVHPAVRADFDRWAEEQSANDIPYVIVESAILLDSEFVNHVDLSVGVLAPEELRLQRVVNRDGVSVEQVRERIAAQMSEEEMFRRCDYTVVNIIEGEMDDAAQRLDQIFKHEALKRENEVRS
ncbi:MAG: dephospho-CoA kinase [Rikenellaceae bacterium]